MESSSPSAASSSPMVMVAPLDWGLGHATRCIPIIDALTARGVRVLLAGDGRSLQLLRRHYPDFTFEELPSYAIRYSKGKRHVLMLAKQLPHVLQTVKAEHQRTEELVEKYGLSGIISDNRYGPWTRKVPCVVMSHQLAVMPPPEFNLLRRWLYDRHIGFLSKYDEVWVPDLPGEAALSGSLTQAFPWPKGIYPLGALSRFNGRPSPADFTYPELQGKTTRLAVVLSGPEPQRSILEEKIIEQAKSLPYDVWLVQGKPESNKVERDGNVVKVSFMDIVDLQRLLETAGLVLSRSGYTSLLDYAALKRKGLILIPTPGQTEQVYLAEYWAEKGWAIHQDQKHFDLLKAVKEAETLTQAPGGEVHPDYLGPVLDRFIARFRK